MPRTPPNARSPLLDDVNPRGSCVTPGVSSARSENRRPFRGNSPISCSSSTAATSLDCVSMVCASAATVTVSCAPVTLSTSISSAAPPTSTRTRACPCMPAASARTSHSLPGLVPRCAADDAGGGILRPYQQRRADAECDTEEQNSLAGAVNSHGAPREKRLCTTATRGQSACKHSMIEDFWGGLVPKRERWCQRAWLIGTVLSDSNARKTARWNG